MPFEYLGNSSATIYVGGNYYTFAVEPERAYTAQVQLDGLEGRLIHIDIAVNFDLGGGPAWRNVWTSGEFTPTDADGYGEVPALTIPPFSVAREARMDVWLVTGTDGSITWDLFGL